MSALDTQIGGTHYKECKIQPVEFIEANNLTFLEGNIVKRIARHNKASGKGRQDIEKVIHEAQLLLEFRYPELETPDDKSRPAENDFGKHNGSTDRNWESIE